MTPDPGEAQPGVLDRTGTPTSRRLGAQEAAEPQRPCWGNLNGEGAMKSRARLQGAQRGCGHGPEWGLKGLRLVFLQHSDTQLKVVFTILGPT